MSEPVSWRMIRAGWTVEAADGTRVGEVDEVTGDDGADIFDGLAVATSALGHPSYVPAEKVAGIVAGTVRLSLTREEVGALPEYVLPPTSLEIEPDTKGGVVASGEAEVRKLVGELVQPVRPRAKRVGLLDRLRFLIVRKRSS